MATSTIPFGVAVAQFAPGSSQEANLTSIRDLATRAAERGARLVVFPEYSSYFTDPLGPEFAANAESLAGPFVSALAQLATELQIHIVAGLVEAVDDVAKFSNTLVALDETGELVASYRKLHLYDAFGARESDWVVPGEIDQPQIFEISGVGIGLQTCYDVRFPEVTRRLVDAGADLVLIPAEWVRGVLKEQHWRTLVTARAVENTIYVAAADQTPPIGVGNSLIVDPMGVALAALGETPDVAIAWVDPARIDAVRAINPALALRRFVVGPRS
jgi:predicted amidohydrolase